jgi:hypothetical protein
VREPGLVQNVQRGGYLGDDVDDPAWPERPAVQQLSQ